MTAWYAGPLASYDCESTGVDPTAARLVTAALILPDGSSLDWLAAVEEEIPAQATAVHGISTEYAREHGAPPAVVVEEVCVALAKQLTDGAALVIMNAPYDLGVLDAECARYGLETVRERIGRPVEPVVDPLVLDRAADKWRKGKRTLTALAEHYKVELTDAHTAGADAEAALRVSLAIGRAFPELDAPADVLHRWQVTWHQRWAADFEAYLRKSDATAVIERGWPVRGAA
jgi:DNA polymerase-3 subunit epsilon